MVSANDSRSLKKNISSYQTIYRGAKKYMKWVLVVFIDVFIMVVDLFIITTCI